MLYPIDKQKLIDEIRYALPTNRICEVASNVAVQNPLNHEIYFLKNRDHDVTIPTDNFTMYSIRGYENINFDALHKQSLMIDPSILNHRAKAAFEQLAAQ